MLRTGFEAINQSHADALTASLAPNPQFFTDIQLLPLTHTFSPERQGGPPQFDAIVSYPIDWFLFGKRTAQMQATDLSVRVSEAEYQNLIRTRVLEAALGYYDVLEAKALHNIPAGRRKLSEDRNAHKFGGRQWWPGSCGIESRPAGPVAERAFVARC